ncbi:tyrosine-protein phosphatase [Facklamia lactis]|uniref:tyrosine-protein phosphatase n=1 Tax=Facklamia lactis TaxID=2749967 RepID=UPI0018CCAC5E|nr:tyrosine-protein phosphatase [Facklamia lactis]MBG9981052.1 tyrosine-protein phosphatase [Facklamia lactis]
MKELNFVRLPLQTVENCRDLGGYPTYKGKQTRWHIFLRSSSLDRISSEDLVLLLEYGVSTILDFRDENEISTSFSLNHHPKIDYYSIRYQEEGIQDIAKTSERASELTLGAFYLQLLEQKESILKMFKVLLNAEGAVIFNCTAGKDRTGVFAMLLLGLAGVSRKDILTNYQVSFTNLESLQRNIEKVMELYDIKYLHSPVEEMAFAYDFLIEHYHSIDNYLRSCGLTTEELDVLVKRFVYS